MLYRDPLAAPFAAWRGRSGPRLLALEVVPGADARRRLRDLVGGERASAVWVRPSPDGAPPSAATLPSGGAEGDGSALATRNPDAGEIWDSMRELAAAGDRRLWVVDDADRLPGAAWDALLSAWSGIRGQALPVHLVLAGAGGVAARLGEVPHDRLRLEPLPAATWLSRATPWSALDRVRAAAVFGRAATLHGSVDPSRSVGRNVRSLFLAPDAPHATLALERIRRSVQRPERYLRVARALAEGRTEWGDVREAVGGLAGSGQLGPYMKTLEDLGVVVGERSLDAPPRSRSRRWRLVDPHLGFWFSCVLPAWDRLGVEDARSLWTDVVRPRLGRHVARTLPLLLREWLAGPDAAELLGGSARETGGLWGDGYDIDVAATLRNGAIVYAWCRWDGGGFTPREVEARLAQVRATRYGFGRERRIRLFLQRDPPGHELARLDARDPELFVLDVRRLAGLEAPGR